MEQGFVLQAAYAAVEDAGITLRELHNTTTGIFVAGYCTFLVGPHTLTWVVPGLKKWKRKIVVPTLHRVFTDSPFDAFV